MPSVWGRVMAEKIRTILCGDSIKANLAHQILNDAGIRNVLVPEKAVFCSPHIQVFESDADHAVEILQSSGLFNGSNGCPIIV